MVVLTTEPGSDLAKCLNAGMMAQQEVLSNRGYIFSPLMQTSFYGLQTLKWKGFFQVQSKGSQMQ